MLGAALLHAGWNAVVKLGLDRFSSVLLLAVVQAIIAFCAMPFVTQPLAAGWIWIVASAILHTGYKIFLIEAYKHGDLSQVYPLARGAAPLMVALASLPLMGERLGPAGMASVALIAVGVILMSMRGGADLGRMRGAPLAWALGTAAFTASYTIVDGLGARIAGTASGFVLWMAVGDAIGMLIYAYVLRGWSFVPALLPAWKTGLAAGAMSLASYWIAVWAFARAPIAPVAALRETSVLFAMAIAVLFLGEKVTHFRILAALLIVAGVALVRL